VVKGSLRIFGLAGRHAWNLAWIGDRVALVDVTLPSRTGPLILIGNSEEEVYGRPTAGSVVTCPRPTNRTTTRSAAQ
jgi:hypothetical protein